MYSTGVSQSMVNIFIEWEATVRMFSEGHTREEEGKENWGKGRLVMWGNTLGGLELEIIINSNGSSCFMFSEVKVLLGLTGYYIIGVYSGKTICFCQKSSRACVKSSVLYYIGYTTYSVLQRSCYLVCSPPTSIQSW